jgi:pimeloyl-ACP methyl ester carboxylesterase
VADVLYFHGFGDRLDNHEPLWQLLANNGSFRVIGFDLPSHGDDYGPGNNIDLFSFTKLAQVAAAVESFTMQDPARPLVLMGWSTGGLIVHRLVQALDYFDRRPRVVCTFAPALDPKNFVGDHGVVTLPTLTHLADPPVQGPIKPQSPFEKPIFAGDLVTNAGLSRAQGWPGPKEPTPLPTLVITAGKYDEYVHSQSIQQWVWDRRSADTPIAGLQCPNSYHWLDEEVEPIGSNARNAAVAFVIEALRNPALTNSSWTYSQNSPQCFPF